MTPSESQGPRPARDREADEVDPTGIRDLLAALPDPGPMPADLVERITARLEVERAHLAGSAPEGLTARSDAVIDLAAERSHRRPARTLGILGIAAAGLLLTTVTVGELAGGPLFGRPATMDSAAHVPTSAEGRDESGAGGESGADGGGDAGGAADTDAAAEQEAAAMAADDAQGTSSTGLMAAPGSWDLVPPLGEVTLSNYRERMIGAVTADLDEDEADDAPPLTVELAEGCWQTVERTAGTGRAEPWPSIHAAEAELDGDSVVVLLATDTAAVGVVAVLPWSCTEDIGTTDTVQPLDVVTWGF